MMWHQFQGPAHWIIYSGQIAFGAALSLLGLLDIGTRDIDVTSNNEIAGTNPMYSKLPHNDLPLAIVAIVYMVGR
jgi:hypothetical protein